MDYSTDSVQEVKTHEDLSCDFLDKVKRKSFVVVAFEDFEEVDSKDFEDHAEVVAVGPLVEEGVEEIEDVGVISVVVIFVGLVGLEGLNPRRMISITGHFLQYLNLSWL